MPEDQPPSRTSFATVGIIAALAVNCALLAGVLLSLEQRRGPAPPAAAARTAAKSIPLTLPAAPAERPSPGAPESPAASDASGAAVGATPERPNGSPAKPEADRGQQEITGTIGRAEASASSAKASRNILEPRSDSAGNAAVDTARRAVVPVAPAFVPSPPPVRATAVTPSVPSAPGLPDLFSAAPLPSPIAPPAYTPVAAPAPVTMAPGGGRVFDGESAVLAGLLREYESAYQRRDAAAAAAVWPTVDLRALTRAFARLRMQNLEFGDCTFAVAQTEATARCVGVLRYAQRIGDAAIQTDHHVWTVEFVRADSWKIARITAQ
jgi:hypothetical protein